MGKLKFGSENSDPLDFQVITYFDLSSDHSFRYSAPFLY